MADTLLDPVPTDPTGDPVQADSALEAIYRTILHADPHGARAARVMRYTFDQIYDGVHTGRYSVEQLFKTEKTHIGTLVEINLRREFADVISDGHKMDYEIAGHDIDCKFSLKFGGWMLPLECYGYPLLVVTADDTKARWSMGVVRASEPNRKPVGKQRDKKTYLSSTGKEAIRWIHRDSPMTPNVLLGISEEDRHAILSPSSGQARVNELFRRLPLHIIGRETVATVGQQKDYMKRVRYNGGARSCLQPEGYLILGGDYQVQREIAFSLGIDVPGEGELISLRVVPAISAGVGTIRLEDRTWRAARADEVPRAPAPRLPTRTAAAK